jgi:transposase InsO family protein
LKQFLVEHLFFQIFTKAAFLSRIEVTYIWTDMGWLYLATVIDLFSRKVVGWSMSNRMKTSLVNDAIAENHG